MDTVCYCDPDGTELCPSCNDIVDAQFSANAGDEIRAELAFERSLPSDYEECSDCRFDHEYNPVEAAKWHLAHPVETDAG